MLNLHRIFLFTILILSLLTPAILPAKTWYVYHFYNDCDKNTKDKDKLTFVVFWRKKDSNDTYMYDLHPGEDVEYGPYREAKFYKFYIETYQKKVSRSEWAEFDSEVNTKEETRSFPNGDGDDAQTIFWYQHNYTTSTHWYNSDKTKHFHVHIQNWVPALIPILKPAIGAL
jgi:hypothetical protein